MLHLSFKIQNGCHIQNCICRFDARVCHRRNGYLLWWRLPKMLPKWQKQLWTLLCFVFKSDGVFETHEYVWYDGIFYGNTRSLSDHQSCRTCPHRSCSTNQFQPSSKIWTLINNEMILRWEIWDTSLNFRSVSWWQNQWKFISCAITTLKALIFYLFT